MSDTSASDASAQPEQPIVEITNCWPTSPDGADDGVHEHLIASEPTEPRKIPLRFVQGFFMGSADIVPGVSGGTVALVFGIYHAFVGNIRIAAKSVIALLKGDFSGAVSGLGLTKASFRTAGTFDWYFIVSLLAGILTAFVLLRHQIESLLEQSNGGFGAYLTLAHNWANTEATKKSYELLARHVMPRFQSSGGGLVDAANRAQAVRPALAEKQLLAVEEATTRYEEEKGAIVLT